MSFRKHSLVIILAKSKLILFGKLPKPKMREQILQNLNISIDKKVLEFVDHVRSLGFMLDHRLRLDLHDPHTMRKALMNLKTIFSKTVIKNLHSH